MSPILPLTNEPFYKQKTRDITEDKEYKMREFGAFEKQNTYK